MNCFNNLREIQIMDDKTRNEFILVVKKVAERQKSKLEKFKSNHSDLKRDDFLWHYLLQSFSTMGNSKGWYGLIGNPNNYNQLKFEILGKIGNSKKRLNHIKTICRRAKIRMPDQKAEFIEKCYLKINELGGLVPAKIALFEKFGRTNKINFLKEFSGIGEKYARNIMMDVYHEDFRDTIAIDSRIKNILSSWSYKNKDYEETELFLLQIAKESNLNGWELDRLMYNFEKEFINKKPNPISIVNELSYSDKQRKEAKDNKLSEKLYGLRNQLQKEPEFLNYHFSDLDDSRSNDFCFWLSGEFSDIVGIQIKHQHKTEKIVINLRPINYKSSLKEPFKKLLEKKGIIVEPKLVDPYVGIQNIFVIPEYRRGILRVNYEEIKALLNSTIDWIRAI